MTTNPGGLIGQHPALLSALRAAERVAPTRSTVLILGETGTGKEHFARLVHDQSGRRGPFVALNCATLVGTLLESELFGHERGSFTGATASKAGLFEAAEGGTLFLDEIGDLSSSLQASLLRALQERRIRRVGGTREIPVDVRVVAATHQDLARRARECTFRADFYHRLAEYRLNIPPLRDRGEDVLFLARHFLKGASGVRTLDGSAEVALRVCGWPGNVRELRNLLTQLTIDVPEGPITGDHVRDALGSPENPEADAIDRDILAFLARNGPTKASALRDVLQVPRTTLQRRMSRLIEDGRVQTSGKTRACCYTLPSAR